MCPAVGSSFGYGESNPRVALKTLLFIGCTCNANRYTIPDGETERRKG